MGRWREVLAAARLALDLFECVFNCTGITENAAGAREGVAQQGNKDKNKEGQVRKRTRAQPYLETLPNSSAQSVSIFRT